MVVLFKQDLVLNMWIYNNLKFELNMKLEQKYYYYFFFTFFHLDKLLIWKLIKYFNLNKRINFIIKWFNLINDIVTILPLKTGTNKIFCCDQTIISISKIQNKLSKSKNLKRTYFWLLMTWSLVYID